MPLGWPELLVILVIVLLVVGPKRLPMLGRQLGGGMREFKDSISRKSSDDDDGDDGEATDAFGRPQLARSEQVDPLADVPDATRAPTGARDEPATRPGRDSA
jgi:sec-independent protein translocase protein TatA